jgi:hypothetical protein
MLNWQHDGRLGITNVIEELRQLAIRNPKGDGVCGPRGGKDAYYEAYYKPTKSTCNQTRPHIAFV